MINTNNFLMCLIGSIFSTFLVFQNILIKNILRLEKLEGERYEDEEFCSTLQEFMDIIAIHFRIIFKIKSPLILRIYFHS